MRLLGVICGVLAVTLGAGTSWADGSIKDGPAPVARGCGGSFGGYYIGGQVGYIDHDAKFHEEIDNDGYVTGDDNGVTFGIYSGYNIHCGGLLYGIESDFNYGGTDAKWIDPDPCCDQSTASELRSFGTIRGRLGLVHADSWLFYVTGGLAYGKFDNEFVLGDLDFADKQSDTKFGWTLGGGVEFLRKHNWSLKAEALYVDLGKEKIDYDLSDYVGDPDCGVSISCVARIGYENEFWVARIGIAYHFGAREEVVPLK